MAASVARADLQISNVRAAQRVGTKYVDVYYDLTDDGLGTAQPVSPGLSISDDDGKTFVVPAASLSGTGFGAGQVAGINNLITWNAGVDWNDKVSPNMRFEVKAALPDDLVLIPAGSFTMGDSTGVGYSDETVHTVQVSAFYIGKYEVTKTLWDKVRTWGASHGYMYLPVGAAKAANHPVETVSWYDVAKWCNARSEMEGRTPCYKVAGVVFRSGDATPGCTWSANGYRLPTESEWEKAARGTLTGQNFPWGNTITHSLANYVSSSKYAYDVSPTPGYHPTYGTGAYPYTSPVGSFAANGYGLYDMAGNVFEWCWDWYGTYPAGPVTDPRGVSSSSCRVFRGGGWSYYADGCRAASRYYSYSPALTTLYLGFRVGRSSVP